MKSTIKEFLRAVLRKVGLEVKRLPATAEAFEQAYIRGGRVPWSFGYSQAKRKFISKIITDPNLLEIFNLFLVTFLRRLYAILELS